MASSPSKVFWPLPESWLKTAAQVHASGRQLVIALTGGGSGAVTALLQTPGASRSVLEVVVPYSLAALTDWLGAAPEQACSAATARQMAMAAFMRARALAPETDAKLLVGAGCTASLASDRPKRGEHRLYVAVQTAERSLSHSLVLAKGLRDRAGEESMAAAAVLWSLGIVCGVEAGVSEVLLTALTGDEHVNSQYERGGAALTDLLLGNRRVALVKPASNDAFFDTVEAPPVSLLFPGAFNPIHRGHLEMANVAERRVGQPLAWEISMANVDKPPLDFISLRQRVDGIRSEDHERPIALTRAATFREKAEVFPGATFVVGTDTIGRIAEPRYYGGDVSRRDEAVAAMAGHGCRLLVFGREGDGRFQTLAELGLPAGLRALCDEVPEAEFREDVSSTALRADAERWGDA
jgi:hypothetical protein